LLRFLFGGLATVAGLVLLFIASFGDPAVVLDQFDWVIAKVAPGHPPSAIAHSAADNGPAGEPSEQAMAVVQPSQPPATPPAAPPPVAQPTQAPMPQQAPILHQAPPPSQAQASPSPPAPALADQAPAAPSSQQAGPSSQQIEQAAALRAQREALQQQLLLLRAEMAQASQSVSSLHNQAAQERHDLDALAQQRALAEAQIRQLDASRQQQATQTAQITQPPAPEVNSEQQQADSQTPAAAPTQFAQAAMQPAPPTLPLPPPLPSNPPQPSPQVTAAPASPLPQVAAATGAPAAGRLAAGNPDRAHSPHAGASDPGALHAALERLRHEPPAVAPQPPPPGPDVAARGDDAAPIRSADAAFGQPPRANGPRVRLRMARDALQAGRIEDARQYLEEAQLQLVFRPVTPAGDEVPGHSRLAGDVASALSMLGAGNTDGALQYLNRAMGESPPGGFPPPQGYGYGRPLGGAPIAQVGQ
jgi:hypothetical protein